MKTIKSEEKNNIAKKKYTGKSFNLNCGSIAKIKKYISYNEVYIETTTGYKICVSLDKIKKGTIKDLLFPSIYNVGFLGIGTHNDYQSRKYQVWIAMLERCYSGKLTAYKNCFVDEYWHNFQNFGDWFDKNYIKGYDLDKDYLKPGNKIYSKENCMFLPSEINDSFNSKNDVNRKLPFGIVKTKSGKFRTQINNSSTKTFLTIDEAKVRFWSFQFDKAKRLMQKYPDFSHIIFCKFNHFKQTNYNNNNAISFDAHEIKTISDMFYLGMARYINEPLFCETGKHINLGAGTFKTIHNTESINYPECDFEKDSLPYADNSIDVFYCFHILEHINDPKHLLKEVQRCLKIGGYITIVVPYYSSSIQAACVDHIKAFNERTWKNFMESYSYDNGSKNWQLHEHLNIIIGIEEKNLCLMTQFIKTKVVR